MSVTRLHSYGKPGTPTLLPDDRVAAFVLLYATEVQALDIEVARWNFIERKLLELGWIEPNTSWFADETLQLSALIEGVPPQWGLWSE